jgi:hypothetical protein
LDSEKPPPRIADRSSDDPEVDSIGDAWLERRNRRQTATDYQEQWWAEQCLACRYFVPLQGALGTDFGACANAKSPFFGRVMFEHDGCEFFVAADDDSA